MMKENYLLLTTRRESAHSSRSLSVLCAAICHVVQVRGLFQRKVRVRVCVDEASNYSHHSTSSPAISLSHSEGGNLATVLEVLLSAKREK